MRIDTEIKNGLLLVRQTQEGDSTHLSLHGELDLSNAHSLELTLHEALHRGDEVVVDLGELEFIDSTGIALLIGAMSRDGDSPRLSFVPSEFAAVTRVLELTGVTERMPIAGADSPAAAASSPEADGLQTA